VQVRPVVRLTESALVEFVAPDMQFAPAGIEGAAPNEVIMRAPRVGRSSVHFSSRVDIEEPCRRVQQQFESTPPMYRYSASSRGPTAIHVSLASQGPWVGVRVRIRERLASDAAPRRRALHTHAALGRR
jgi:hypothetical protein